MSFPATATFNSLVDEVIHNLGGFTQAHDAMTSLTNAVTASDTTIVVKDASSFSRGVMEIDSELLFIEKVDLAANAITVAPWGRGFRGTTAAAHSANARVTMSPTWPRATVEREINNVIRGLYPWLYGVTTTTLTYDINQFAYGIPADVEKVLEVKVRVPGSQRNWERVRHWDYDMAADVTDFPTGKAVEILSAGIPDAAQVILVYAKRPTVLSAAGDVFSTVSGLQESAKDLVVLGACARLAPYMDAARLPAKSAAADELDQPRQLGTAVQLAREFRQQYTQRLLEEQKSLQERYPLRLRRVR